MTATLVLGAAVFAVLVSMGLLLLRGLVGPTVFDRILAANLFGTKTVLLIALIAFLVDNTMYLDVALIYALINFIATVALLKYFKHGTLNLREEE